MENLLQTPQRQKFLSNMVPNVVATKQNERTTRISKKIEELFWKRILIILWSHSTMQSGALATTAIFYE